VSDIHSERILILDFGSQYTQLIARRVREAKVYCEIFPYNAGLEKVKAFRPKGLILSGGPSSVYDAGAPLIDKAHLDLGVPVLGICYGMQLLTHVLGGQVAKSAKREYGRADLNIHKNEGLFSAIGEGGKTTVWMSHGDRIEKMPDGFHAIAHTGNSPTAAMADDLQQPAAAVMIFLVGFEVISQISNPLGKNCNLHFRGTGIAFMQLERVDDLLFLVCSQHLAYLLSSESEYFLLLFLFRRI